MNPIIKVDSVTKLYGGKAAVNNLNLEVNQSEILGLIGQNGAGKTTTLKMIVGLVKPTSGVITVMGENIVKKSKAAHQHIGYLPEDSPLYENLTIHQYLNFFAELNGLSKRLADERIEFLLHSLNLADANKLTGELSKGMKRKVAISRALLHNPSLLVLDEPNSGLDPLTSAFINTYLKELRKQGKTVILSAHNLFQIESICDRVAIIAHGQLYACDTIDAVTEKTKKRTYTVLFKADENLEYTKQDGSYIYQTDDIKSLSDLFEQISVKNWILTDISVHQPQLEDVYINLMKRLSE